jgi:CO/xanthine dehydrogenase Mo-binding subunit
VRRRDFLAASGAAGLLLFFRTDPAPAQETERIAARPGYPSDFNAYLRIGPDGRVDCFVGKVELGQGAMTALALLLAEELDVALANVHMTMGDTDLCPWDMGTFGSLSIWQFGPVLRGAGAEARAVLLQMASERLQVPPAELVVEDGVVSKVGDPSRRVTYGALVEGRRIERHLQKVPVKPVKAFRQVGRDAARKDAREKVTGQALYAADLKVEGLLHARVLRPPAHGATLVSANTVAAERYPGARLIREGDLVALLHERPDGAAEALDLVKARWDRPVGGPDDTGIFDHLQRTAPKPASLAPKGDLAEGARAAVQVVEATYTNAYVAHAPI